MSIYKYVIYELYTHIEKIEKHSICCSSCDRWSDIHREVMENISEKFGMASRQIRIWVVSFPGKFVSFPCTAGSGFKNNCCLNGYTALDSCQRVVISENLDKQWLYGYVNTSNTRIIYIII